MDYRHIRVENLTRGVVIAERGLQAGGLLRRTLGLHVLPRLEPGQGLLLPGATTIDTMFMR